MSLVYIIQHHYRTVSGDKVEFIAGTRSDRPVDYTMWPDSAVRFKSQRAVEACVERLGLDRQTHSIIAQLED